MQYPFTVLKNTDEVPDKMFQYGVVVLKSFVDEDIATHSGNLVLECLRRLTEKYGLYTDGKSNIKGFSHTVMRTHEIQDLLDTLTKSPSLLDAIQSLVGPDILMNTPHTVLINHPNDTDPGTNKALHQEAWTGQVLDNVGAWFPLTRTDKNNSLSIVPGSHFYGLLPNRNRALLPIADFEVGEEISLEELAPGDVVLLHSLLLHGTAGRSQNIRLAMQKYYKPTFTETSARLKSLGMVPARAGAFTRIRDQLGNDLWTPLRTYGVPQQFGPDIDFEL